MVINLLKNRDSTFPLGSFDGKVGALVTVGQDNFFITTNADYIPALPSIEFRHALILQSDCRYGKDDPMLWPQQYCQEHPHLPFIAKMGARTELDVLWWDPAPADFVVVSAVTPGLGRLHPRCIARFLVFVNNIMDRVRRLAELQKPLPPIFGRLSQHIIQLVERLQTLPGIYLKTVVTVTSLQRACLELDAACEYLSLYKSKMDTYLAPPRISEALNPTSLGLGTSTRGLGSSLAPCIGAFTTDPTIVQRFYAARIPFWFLRPTSVFAEEIILKVVAPIEPSFVVLDPVGPDGRVLMANTITSLYANTTKAKVEAINAAALQTRWYRDPFNTLGSRPAAHSLPAAASSNTSSAASAPTRSPMKRGPNKPYNSMLRPPTKPKFQVFDHPLMPAAISSWAQALAGVKRSVKPYSDDLDDKRYVFPEPALFASTTSEGSVDASTIGTSSAMAWYLH
ncbi:hypothetical protein C8F01DRAFT_1192142 [Mycena amicta]|nr:hypothetical protein C8F01DRAFT_1192142 [Mycena amicta]